MTSKIPPELRIPCTHSFTILSHLAPPHLKNAFFPTSPIHCLYSPLMVGLRIFPPMGLDKEILNLTRFLILLISPETKRCYPVLTPRPRFFVQSQEPNDANAAKSDVIVTYCSQITLLPQRTKKNFMFLIDSEHKLH